MNTITSYNAARQKFLEASSTLTTPDGLEHSRAAATGLLQGIRAQVQETTTGPITSDHREIIRALAFQLAADITAEAWRLTDELAQDQDANPWEV